SAFEIDGAVGEQRNAGRRRHRIELDRELVELEFVLHGVDDSVTDVDRKSDRLLDVIEIRERDRRVAVADGDGAGFLDLFERPGELFGVGLPANASGEHEADHTWAFHTCSPCWMACSRTTSKEPMQ